MKSVDKFLLHDLKKIFTSCEIGYVIDDVQSYDKALASIRMRCYDMILAMEQAGIKAELYKPFKKYKAVIFTKTRSDKAVKLAKKLHAQGTIIIADVFCENLTYKCWERDNVLEVLKNSDYGVTFSKSQYNLFLGQHSNLCIIEESVNDAFFRVKKKHKEQDKITLLYCGYCNNAKDTLVIKDVIKNLQEKYHIDILYICEKDPDIKEFPYRYEKYIQKDIPKMLLEGDIMIAPRPMEGIGKLPHTLSKIAHPMAVGLPVVASPVASYIGTPAVLCANDEEWETTLSRLIESKEERERLGNISREYIEKLCSQKVICQQYMDIVDKLVSRRAAL